MLISVVAGLIYIPTKNVLRILPRTPHPYQYFLFFCLLYYSYYDWGENKKSSEKAVHRMRESLCQLLK
jgi:hypothetical protein